MSIEAAVIEQRRNIAILSRMAKVWSDVVGGGSSIDVILSASIRKGDFIVLKTVHDNTSGNPPLDAFTGFALFDQLAGGTTLSTDTKGDNRHSFYWKIAEVSDAGRTITVDAGNQGNNVVALVFRGNAPIKTVQVQDVDINGMPNGNPSPLLLERLDDNLPLSKVSLILAAYFCNNNPVDPTTFSPAADEELRGGTNSPMKYKIYNRGEAPADTTIDTDDNGDDNGLMGVRVELF